MPDPQFSDPDKLLAEARPKIHQRIIAAIKKLGPRLQQDSAPAIMGLFLGGIIAPLAALGAPQGGVAQIIPQESFLFQA